MWNHKKKKTENGQDTGKQGIKQARQCLEVRASSSTLGDAGEGLRCALGRRRTQLPQSQNGRSFLDRPLKREEWKLQGLR